MSDRRRTKSRKHQRSIDEEIARRLGPPAPKYVPARPQPRVIVPSLPSHEASLAMDLAEDVRRQRRHKLIVRGLVAISIAGVLACAFVLFK